MLVFKSVVVRLGLKWTGLNTCKRWFLTASLMNVCIISVMIIFQPIFYLSTSIKSRCKLQSKNYSFVHSCQTGHFITADPRLNVTLKPNFTTAAPPPIYLTARLNGRLGNHMFIYATLLGLARAQGRVPFIKDAGQMLKTFGISHIRQDINTEGWRNMIEARYATFDVRFMRLTVVNQTLLGYFQCWRYFQHIKYELRQEFTIHAPIKNFAVEAVASYRKALQNNVIVGVHVRRGDFLHIESVRFGFGVPNRLYFLKAFEKIRSLLSQQNVTFLVVSEDLEWCQENLKVDSSVQILPRENGSIHFAILASCDHVIISGGTYGWWAAWLADGITVYYKKYVREGHPLHVGFTDKDYYPEGWIGLDD